MKLKYLKVGTITVAVIALVTLGVLLYVKSRPNPIIDRTIQKKAGFTIFIPSQDKNAPWVLDKKSIKYDTEIGVLHTNLFTPDKQKKIVMTQQVLPDPFTDVPNYSAIFYSKLHEYRELNLPIGRVTLTLPDELKGGQSAVANIKGTLMFLHPDKDLNDEEWKTVFKSIESL